MKTLIFLLGILFSIVSIGQQENESDVLISKAQDDDVYRAGKTVKVNALVEGDLVVAGGKLTVNDSINGDLSAAGGELFLNGYIADDVRMAVGRAIIDSEIGDDLVVFAGEIVLTESAKIHGNLTCFAGKIEMDGEVAGELNVKGAEVLVNGTVKETSKISGESIYLGPNAKFYGEVEYWNDDGELDFNDALVNTKAYFNEDLVGEQSELSLITLGIASLALWVFYVFSAFLVILVLHALFKSAFSKAVEDLEQDWLKSFAYGLVYLVGIPMLILLAFLLIIGIPLGLFATGVFMLSLLLGHLVAALLLAYFYKKQRRKEWGFWRVTFLALLFAVVLRLLTIIPFLGILISVITLSITYGALTLKVIHPNKKPAKI